MNCLPVPKIMKWDWNLAQAYRCNRKVLVTSGCSFTSTTLTLDCASSWPGFVRDRCRFEYAVDWSFPGSGNLYIADSIIKYIETLNEKQRKDIFVIVMWSGIDREENIVQSSNQPCIDGLWYRRNNVKTLSKEQQTLESYRHIFRTKQYLEQHSIPFAFTFYINLLYRPYLPARDTTHQFEVGLDSNLLSQLRNLPWVPQNSKNYLYDFSFYQDYLDDSPDGFHPSNECVLEWTDKVLLPALAQQNLITKCST